MSVTITKINALGNSTVTSQTFQIPQLAFLADPTDFDFTDGFMELTIDIQTKRDVAVTADGLYDVLVNNQTILTEPIQITADGITDENGILPVSFISPTGIPSNKYTLNFALNFDVFVNEQINPVVLKVVRLDVTRDTDSFSIIDQTLISSDIERDDIKILLVDEEFGETLRVFPTDSRLVFNSVPKTLFAISGACLGAGAGTAPAPQIGRIEVFDSSGELFTFDNGGTGLRFMDELITRNANYTVSMFFSSDQGMIEYGKSQETKTFSCNSELKSNTCTTSCVRQVKAGGQSWTHCRNIVASIVIDPVPVCNLP